MMPKGVLGVDYMNEYGMLLHRRYVRRHKFWKAYPHTCSLEGVPNHAGLLDMWITALFAINFSLDVG